MKLWHKALLLLALAGVMVAGYQWWRDHVRDEGVVAGRAEVQKKWDDATLAQQRVDIETARANAQETQRRLDRQKANQDAHDKELALARADADRNGLERDQLRQQNLSTAQRWRDALGNSPACIECAAAGDAILVLTDVLGRADKRAGDLAGYADTARAAGLKCERDYDALTAREVVQEKNPSKGPP
ncbi:hypothetical protein D9M73_70950 [compost metagenome]